MALADAGHAVAASKPAQSFDPGDDPATTDAAVLGRATGEPAEAVCPPGRWYPAAMAPPMAARALGRPGFTVADLAAEVARSWPGDGAEVVGLVETAGGVRSPQADDGDAVDLLSAALPRRRRAGGRRRPRRGQRRPAVRRRAGRGDRARLVVVLNRFDPADAVHRTSRAWLADHDGLATLAVPGTEDALCRAVLA